MLTLTMTPSDARDLTVTDKKLRLEVINKLDSNDRLYNALDLSHVKLTAAQCFNLFEALRDNHQIVSLKINMPDRIDEAALSNALRVLIKKNLTLVALDLMTEPYRSRLMVAPAMRAETAAFIRELEQYPSLLVIENSGLDLTHRAIIGIQGTDYPSAIRFRFNTVIDASTRLKAILNDFRVNFSLGKWDTICQNHDSIQSALDYADLLLEALTGKIPLSENIKLERSALWAQFYASKLLSTIFYGNHIYQGNTSQTSTSTSSEEPAGCTAPSFSSWWVFHGETGKTDAKTFVDQFKVILERDAPINLTSIITALTALFDDKTSGRWNNGSFKPQIYLEVRECLARFYPQLTANATASKENSVVLIADLQALNASLAVSPPAATMISRR